MVWPAEVRQASFLAHSPVRKDHPRTVVKKYDHIIVGAGPAGTTLGAPF